MYSDQNKKPQSKFVSFGRFLEANRGAAERQAQQLADDVEQRGQKVEGELSDAQKQFDQGVKAGTVQGQEDGNGMGGRAPGASPAAVAEQMRAKAQQTYSGPTQLAGYQGMVGQAQDVSDRAQSLGTQAGIGALMQQRAQGAYGSGARRFDAGLTGAAGGARFSQLRDRFGGMAERLDAANKAAAERAAQAQAHSATQADLYGRNAELYQGIANDEAQRQEQDRVRAERKAEWAKDPFLGPGFASTLDMFYDKATPEEQQQIEQMRRVPDLNLKANMLPMLIRQLRVKYGNR